MIKLQNKQLADYVMFKLNKLENEFTQDELAQIDELLINPVDISGTYLGFDIEELDYFIKLEKIHIIGFDITDELMAILLTMESLKSVDFERCQILSPELIARFEIDELGIINCNISDYSCIYQIPNLKSLEVINGNISIKEINKLKNIEHLQLSYSKLTDIENLELPNLKELYIDNTNIEDLSGFNKLNQLKRLSIDEKQYTSNEESINKIEENGVLVLNENMVEFSKEEM